MLSKKFSFVAAGVVTVAGLTVSSATAANGASDVYKPPDCGESVRITGVTYNPDGWDNFRVVGVDLAQWLGNGSGLMTVDITDNDSVTTNDYNASGKGGARSERFNASDPFVGGSEVIVDVSITSGSTIHCNKVMGVRHGKVSGD